MALCVQWVFVFYIYRGTGREGSERKLGGFLERESERWERERQRQGGSDNGFHTAGNMAVLWAPSFCCLSFNSFGVLFFCSQSFKGEKIFKILLIFIKGLV